MNDGIGFSAAASAAGMPSSSEVLAIPERTSVVAAGEDTTHDSLMGLLADPCRTAKFLSELCSWARKYRGIPSYDAEDIFQESVITYLAIQERYSRKDNRFAIFVGIFRKKVLAFLEKGACADRKIRRIAARLQAYKPKVACNEDPWGAAVDMVIRHHDSVFIRIALAGLPEKQRDLLLTLGESRMTREEMIEALGVNRNTFDTRLRAARMNLAKALKQSGVT